MNTVRTPRLPQLQPVTSVCRVQPRPTGMQEVGGESGVRMHGILRIEGVCSEEQGPEQACRHACGHTIGCN